MKNRSSWSNLGAWGSNPSSLPAEKSNSPQLPRPTNAAQSFETFKKQAEERKHLMTLLKNQEEEQRKLKEQQEQERMRIGQKKQRECTKEAAVKSAPLLPSTGGNTEAQKQKIARLREQERRRRQQMSGRIDMNSQSDIMKSFEENLLE